MLSISVTVKCYPVPYGSFLLFTGYQIVRAEKHRMIPPWPLTTVVEPSSFEVSMNDKAIVGRSSDLHSSYELGVLPTGNDIDFAQ